MEILQGEKCDKVMDKFQPFCSPNIRNLITSFKHSTGIKGPWIAYFSLNQKVFMTTFQDNSFPRQMVGQKVFLFKMSFYGPTSGVNLVRRMQPSGDLQNCWLLFDHVKRVQEWTTMLVMFMT
jgi:hypothetical protein